MSESRREFLKKLGNTTLSLSVLPYLLQSLGWIDEVEGASSSSLHEVEFYDRLPGQKIQCHVCPRHCTLNDGETCFCLTRKNHKGRLYTYAFNNPCKILTDDPIEKLPLHHFHPGMKTISIATGGCNMRCLYCQNWEISQEMPEKLKNYDMTAQDAYDGASSTGVKAISYTYTEPVSFLEYIKSIASYTKPKGIKNVVASALFINKKPLQDLCKYVDAFAVSLKGFNETFYEKVCGEPLQPVLDALLVLKQQKVWFEIVNLLVPTYNTSDEEIKKMCGWIVKNLGPQVPIHFSRFFPHYKLKHLPQTSVQDMEKACAIAKKEGVRHAYMGNLAPHPGNNTYCYNCKKVVVERLGLKVLKNHLQKGKCKFCGEKMSGIF